MDLILKPNTISRIHENVRSLLLLKMSIFFHFSKRPKWSKIADLGAELQKNKNIRNEKSDDGLIYIYRLQSYHNFVPCKEWPTGLILKK